MLVYILFFRSKKADVALLSCTAYDRTLECYLPLSRKHLMLQVPSWSNQSKYLRVWSHTQNKNIRKFCLEKLEQKIKKALKIAHTSV